MTEYILLAMTLSAGILLCFYGFEMFRLCMALAGFYVGMQLGNMLFGLFSERIGESWSGTAEKAFPIVIAVLLALLSYAVYKHALFFLTLFFTTFAIMKVFVVYLIKTEENLDILVKFSPETVEKLKNSSTGAEKLLTDAEVGNILTQIPGQAGWQKLLFILIFSLALGILAGVLIMLIQEPAVKIATSVIGADAIRIALVDGMGKLLLIKGLPSGIVKLLEQGKDNVWVAFFIWAVFIGLGSAVQLRERDG